MTDLWVEERARLSKELEKLFRQATKRFAVPTAEGCAMVALYLMALHGNSGADREEPAGQTKAVRYGKLFLYHLAEERSRIEKWFPPQAQPVLFWFRKQQKILAEIDKTRRHVEALLPALVPIIDHRDPIRQIAAVAKEVWAEANNGRAPKSPNPDDPLCRFVIGALELIGQHYAAETVSAVLRHRRRKQKGGLDE